LERRRVVLRGGVVRHPADVIVVSGEHVLVVPAVGTRRTCGGGVLVSAQELLADHVLVAGALLGDVSHADLAAPEDYPGGAVPSVCSREVGPVVGGREPVVVPAPAVRDGIGVGGGPKPRAAVDFGGVLVPAAGGVIGPGHLLDDEAVAGNAEPGFSVRERRAPARILVRPAPAPAGAVVDG